MRATKEFLLLISLLITSNLFANKITGSISGQVFSTDKDTVSFATVYMKGTNYGTASDLNGYFSLEIPEGHYTWSFLP